MILALATGVSLAATPVDVERLSPPKSASAGELVTHVFSIRNTVLAPIDVLISVELPLGWHELGMPASLRIDAGEEAVLFVTLAVPPTALASEYLPALLIETSPAAADSAPPSIQVGAPVRVLASADLLVASSEAVLPPGGRGTVGIGVRNLGNVQEQIEITVSPPSGVQIEWSPTAATLSVHEILQVDLVVQVDASMTPGRFLVPIVARSTVHEGVVAQGLVEVEILPPDPSRVPSSIATTFPITMQIASRQALPLSPGISMPPTSVSLFAEKILAGNELVFRLQLESLFGPQPLSIASFLIDYETPSVSMRIGEFATSLTSLLPTSVTGARFSVSAPFFQAVAVVSAEPTEATAGGSATFGPEKLQSGIAYLEHRSALSQASSVSLLLQGGTDLDLDLDLALGPNPHRLAGDVPAAWSFELEGALGQDNGVTSWAGTGSVRCDVAEAFVALDAFRTGGAFPFGLADRAGVALHQRYRSDALSLGTSFSHEVSNVEGNPAAVTRITDRLGLTMDLLLPDNLPEITAIANLERQQAIDPVADSIRASYAMTIRQTGTPLPFRSFVQRTDRWDRTFDHRVREWDIVQEFGVAFDSWHVALIGEFATVLDPQTGDMLDGEAHLSISVESTAAVLGGTLLGSAHEDERDLMLSVRFAPADALDVGFDVGLTWDRNDVSVPELSFSLSVETLFNLPLPFASDTGQIEGRVFIDINENGLFDPAPAGGDLPLQGMTVLLLDEPSRVSTDAAGLFRFPALPGKRYTILLDEPPSEAALVASPEIDLAAGERKFIDVPLQPLTQLVGSVIEAESADAARDFVSAQTAMSERPQLGVPGVRLKLTSQDGIVLETLTTASGDYEFRLLPSGTYTVAVDQASLPERFELATPGLVSVSLAAGTETTTDFVGFVRPRQLLITFQPPFADFTVSPNPAQPGIAVLLDGGWSFDFDGEIATYEWDLDGDGEADGFGETIQHRFPTPGEYPVRLTVTDNDNASDSVTISVIVE